MDTLNLTRVGLLLRRRVLLSAKASLSLFVPMLAILVISAISSNDDLGNVPGEDGSFFDIWYGIFLLGGGFLLTASLLTENKDPNGREAYLTLPASNTEKWLAAYLLSGPLFVVVFSLTYALFTVVVNWVWGATVGQGFLPFDLFASIPATLVKTYLLIVHPVAFVGAIAYNRAAPVKTLGVGFAALVALGLFAALCVRIVYREAFTGFWTQTGQLSIEGNPLTLTLGEDGHWWVTALFALGLYAASFFKWREKQV